MKKIKSRVLWVDYVKGLCMAAVILNHLYGPEVYGCMTYPFELAGFFFVAGYTFNLKENFPCFLRGKIQSLLIPVMIFGLINAVLSCYVKGGSLSSRIAGILVQRPGKWDFLWFVACLFTTMLIFYPVVRFISSSLGKLAICLALSVCGYMLTTFLPTALPWHIENSCIMVMFTCIGYIVRQSRFDGKIITDFKTGKTHLAFLGMLLIAYIWLVLTVRNYPIDIHLHQYGQFAVFMVSAWMGLGIIFSVSILLEQWHNSPAMRFCGFIGANTLVYYAFQSKVISILAVLGEKMGFYSHTYIGCVIFCMLTCIILVIPSYLIRRYAPFMLGRF